MRANLRLGLLLGNHHPEVEDELALELILDALEAVRERTPGEVIVALYTPEDSVWVVTLDHGVWELEKNADGTWEAVKVSC